MTVAEREAEREWEESLRGTDSRGISTPHRLSGFTYVKLLTPGLAHRVVPESHVVKGAGHLATITCVCGETAEVKAGTAPHGCKCGRFFFYNGTEVWAFGPFSGDGVH